MASDPFPIQGALFCPSRPSGAVCNGDDKKHTTCVEVNATINKGELAVIKINIMCAGAVLFAVLGLAGIQEADAKGGSHGGSRGGAKSGGAKAGKTSANKGGTHRPTTNNPGKTGVINKPGTGKPGQHPPRTNGNTTPGTNTPGQVPVSQNPVAVYGATAPTTTPNIPPGVTTNKPITHPRPIHPRPPIHRPGIGVGIGLGLGGGIAGGSDMAAAGMPWFVGVNPQTKELSDPSTSPDMLMQVGYVNIVYGPSSFEAAAEFLRSNGKPGY